MKCKLIRLKTTDNTNLEGFITNGRKKSVVIHLHGLEDNFHERPFLDLMAEEYQRNGFDLLSFDTRGHDFLSQIERFTDCILDIDAAIRFVKKRGYKNIVLQGHSTGCNKIVYYTQKRKSKLKGVILLSPMSDCEYAKLKEKDYGKNMKKAEELVRKRKGKQLLLLKGTKWPIAAQRYLSLGTFGGAEDMFSLNLGKKTEKKYQGFKFPVLVVYGEKDKYAIHSIKKIGEFLAGIIPSPVSLKYISNAGHNFKKKERELVKAITKWLKLL